MESMVCRVLGVHLEKEVDLCQDLKETRGNRAHRGHQGHLSLLSVQKTRTSKEKRVFQGLKEPADLKDLQV